MSATILAQIFGVVFLLIGLSFIVNKKDTILAMNNIIENKGLLWLTGFITLILGSTILVIPAGHWFITLIGLMLLVKSVMMIVFPDFAGKLYKKFTTQKMIFIAGIICIVISFLLIYIELY